MLRMEYFRDEIGSVKYLSCEILPIMVDLSKCFIELKENDFVHFN